MGSSASPGHASAVCEPSAARLTIVHITDVYVLDNFPHLRNLIRAKKRTNPNTISMLTGDFLAPYLLSSLDNGIGMMSMIKKTPIDYLTWGNHEADISHAEVCKRVVEFHESGGVWINSNMQSHEMMQFQVPYQIVEVPSLDGSQVRKVGFVAVLSDDKSLYKKFKHPGAFNGAHIDCPWETLAKYKKELETMGCDLVVPLQHLYEKEDMRTCQEFDFPLILSGHDHHKVDKEVNGTRLLKPGLDGHYATVLDITWDSQNNSSPTFAWEFVRVKDFEADEEMTKAMDESYEVLLKLRNTELAPVPQHFRPLSSIASRSRVTTMGKYICTLVRNAINSDKEQHDVDLCLIRGGHICGEKEYPPDSFFSLEDLETVNTDKVSIGIVEMPGDLLVRGVKSTRGSTSRLFVQYDDGITEDASAGVTHVAGKPIELAKLYRVATTPTTIMDIPVFAEYYDKHSTFNDEVIPLECELMCHFARTLWHQLLRLCDPSASGDIDISKLDTNGDGIISKQEIQDAMKSMGLHVADGEFTLVNYIVHVADKDNDGEISFDDLKKSNMSRASVLVKKADPYGRRSLLLPERALSRRASYWHESCTAEKIEQGSDCCSCATGLPMLLRGRK
eukprot:TRINITY_DN39534_c0_g1_i1.p1 TRINITY_DN39534_c0_g1~~TRINITY_DN39534_c0_g1_i1.p1  ORF type:complete len:619 (+),score=82.11 TRINITY_DN39534_c0_g1_i1:71-1927(+)